jgi:hypothetical protein
MGELHNLPLQEQGQGREEEENNKSESARNKGIDIFLWCKT